MTSDTNRSKSESVMLILGGLSLQWLRVGLGFPARNWGQVVVVRAPKPSQQTSGQWQGSWPLALKERISTKMKSSEASIYWEEKVQYMWTDTWADSEGESLICWVTSLWQCELLLWNISSQFPLSNHSDLPGHSLYLGYLRLIPCVFIHLSHDGFYCKGLWVEHPLTWLPFGLQGAFSTHMWTERSPDFGNEKYVVCAVSSLLP